MFYPQKTDFALEEQEDTAPWRSIATKHAAAAR